MHSVLAMKTRQALTENNIKRKKHIRARRNSSKGLPNDTCEISNLANIAKKQPLLDLQHLHWNHSSAVLLQTQVCCIGRTCFSSFSVTGDINVNMS